MWITPLTLLTLVSVALTAPMITPCPQRCSCTASGVNLKVRCQSFDFLKPNLSPELINAIEALDMSNSSLIKINSNLKNLNSLKRLNFTSNKIQHITAAYLPKSLEYLDLSNNYIKRPPQDLHLLPNLRAIDLYGNPIVCDCDIESTPPKGVSLKRLVTCAYPQELKGQSWQSLTCNRSSDRDLFQGMQGDAPYEGSGSEMDVDAVTGIDLSDNVENSDSSIEDEFIRMGTTNNVKQTVPPEPKIEEPPELEGSGDVSETTEVTKTTEATKATEAADLTEVPALSLNVTVPNEIRETTTSKPTEDEDEDDEDEDDEDEEDDGEDDEDDDDEDEEDYPEENAESSTPVEPLFQSMNKSLLDTAHLKICHFNCSTPTPLNITNDSYASPPPNLLEGIAILAEDLGIIDALDTTKTPEIPVTTVETTTANETDFVTSMDVEILEKNLSLQNETGSIIQESQYSTTFVFLGVLLLFILSLIIFVIVKKRYGRSDFEIPPDERSEKDVQPEEMELIEKPDIQKTNGTQETVPLINGQKGAEDVPTNEMEDEADNVQLRSSVNEKPTGNPETKRVTIKATEIPHSTPKTPILVTRHFNSDGSVVTTPAVDQQIQ